MVISELFNAGNPATATASAATPIMKLTNAVGKINSIIHRTPPAIVQNRVGFSIGRTSNIVFYLYYRYINYSQEKVG